MARSKYDRLQDKELAALLREIDALYSELANTIGFIGATGAPAVDKEKPFSLSDYPFLKARVDKALQRLAKKLDTAIVNGVRSQWTLANKKNDELCRLVFGANLDKITEARRRRYFTNNDPALAAFVLRRETGLSLSQRVWKYAEQTRGEIESTLELGIKTGEDAGQMARNLKEYLRFPDKLFRRVRDEEGNLHLSKNAAAFHPGPGVYRSSYKNARRLAATETNIAYHSADHLRHTQLDFVVGIRINLSNNHTTLNSKGVAVPFHDICDELKGDYPKWFKFVGWHPQCRCFVTTILKTPEEVMRDSDGIDRGSVNAVKKMPPQWEDWLDRNIERVESAEDRGTLPYFLRDNEWAWKEGVELDVEQPKTALLKAEERHASRTPEQIADIKARWTERAIAYNDAEMVLRLVDSIPGLAEYWESRPTDESKELAKLRLRFNTGKFKSYAGLSYAAQDVLENLHILRDKLSILDNPMKVMKKWGVDTAFEIKRNVERTMGRYSGESDKVKAEKYRFEAKWIEEHRKDTIPTWKEAQDAYLKAARELEWKIEWEAVTEKLDKLARDPLANPALIERARQYIGKDKASADKAVQDVEDAIRLDAAKSKFKSHLRKHPKLLASFEDSMELALDPDDAEEVMRKAKVFLDAWEEAERRAYAVKKKIPERMWGPIEAAINADDYGELGRLVKEAETYASLEAMRTEIRDMLGTSDAMVIENANPKLYSQLQDDLHGAKPEDALEVSRRIAVAKDIIEEFADAVLSYHDYSQYQTRSSAYLALIQQGSERIADNDLKGLKSVLAKLKDERERLERDRKYAEEREAEWKQMRAFVERVMALGANDAVLDSLIASFVANEATKKVVRMARADVAAITARLAELGLSVGGRVTLADLKARLGDKMPKTLEHLQARIDAERKDMFRRDSDLKDQEETIIKRLAEIFEKNIPGMNVPFYGRDGKEAVNAIFRSYFKSQLETGTGNGCVNRRERENASAELFGSEIANMKGRDYEKYGFLMSRDILKQLHSGIADWYWRDTYHHDERRGVQIRFKPEKVIATYTMQDSLGSDLAPALLTDPQITTHYYSEWYRILGGDLRTDATEATRKYASSYIELQYHGDLTLDCIESVYVELRWFKDFDDNALSVMQRLGIPLYTEIENRLCTYNFIAKRWEATINGKPSYYNERDGQFEAI